MTIIATNLSLSQARALEEILITAFAGNTLKNAIHSIAKGKLNKFKKEFKQMRSLLSSYRNL